MRYYYSVGHFVIGSIQTHKVADHWRHNFDRRLITVVGNAELAHYAEYPDGRRRHFNSAGQEIFNRDGAAARLVATASGGWLLTLPNADVEEYDSAGKLVAITSRAGIVTTLTYDLDQRLVSVVNAFGHELTFSYADDELDSVSLQGTELVNYSYSGEQLTSAYYPDGTSKTYHYEHRLPWLLTGITDEQEQRFATYTYDNFGRVVVSEHAGSADRFEFSYGSGSGARLTTVKDPLGTSRVFRIAKHPGTPTSWKLAAIQNAPCQSCGNVFSITYSGSNPASMADYRNLLTCYKYDVRNLETGRIEGLNVFFDSCPSNFATYVPPAGSNQRKILTQWHSTYRLPIQIDEIGRRTTFTHDANGNVLTQTVLDTTSSQARTWTYTYNSLGQVLTVDGPRTDVADVTTSAYYACSTGYECGRVHTVTNALGHVITYDSYNVHGQPLAITDENGVVTTLTYDARQRIASRTIGGEQTTFEYWPMGSLKKVTLPGDSYLEYTYDSAHRLVQINDSEGNRVAYTLDAMGNRTSEQVYDPTNVLTLTRTRVFSALNRLTEEIGAAGTASVTTTFAYDTDSNLTGITAPLGRNSTQTYDSLNRLQQVTDPLLGVTKHAYNSLDQLISVTDPRNKITSYAYNAFGNLTQQVSPDTGTTTNTYDSAGNLATSTDARSKTGTYAYDALNRVTSVTYPDQTIGYTYDSGTNQKGRLMQVTDASGSTSWTYDTHGRVLSRQQSMGISKTLGYAYDSFGRLQTLTLPSGNAITYGYTDSKIASLTLNGSTTILSNVLYQPFGPTRGWTWGNSTFAIREYDTDGKVTDIESAGLKTYSYDDAFRITGITDAANSSLSQSYGYDLLDRLTSATGTSLSQGWTYDANGNRLTQTGGAASTYTVSSTNNRVSSVSGALTRTYSYDNSGSTTSDGTVTFSYNDAGRMVSATKASITTTYALNALGERVRKTTSGLSTYFVYDDAGRLVGEYDNSGNLIQETVWFGDAPVATLRPNGGGVSLFYIHTDHLSTPRRISRPSDSVVVWRWDSDPFGTTTANENPDGDSNLFSFNLRFPGQYLDQETGLHYNYFRDYDPAVGRYVESDPIGLEGGLNTYAYVGGNPVSLVDPFGLEAQCDIDCEELKKKDEAKCRSLPNITRWQKSVRARCWGSAVERYGACRAKKPLPPLVTWRISDFFMESGGPLVPVVPGLPPSSEPTPATGPVPVPAPVPVIP